MTASTAAFSLTPGIQISLASHSPIDAPRAKWAATARRALARASTASAAQSGWVWPGAQEHHDCVTTVLIIGRWGAPAAQLSSMTGPSGGHRQ
jgi:hypothetical protein